MISVVIATRNRADKIGQCLRSILDNSYQNFEIIVIDQSERNKTKQVILGLPSSKIHYKHSVTRGKSHALNEGLKTASGEIISFTDDDCIVTRHWLQSIVAVLNEYHDLSGVFGNTLPYQPWRHSNELCPSTFTVPRQGFFYRPDLVHYYVLGLGNNMSIRKSVFEKIGQFKEWLGPGLSGQAGGEESEFIFRMLANGLTLMANPNIVVHHNRWLTDQQEKKLQNQYSFGLIAFQSYYLLSKYRRDSVRLIKIRLNERLIPRLKQIAKLKVWSVSEITDFMQEAMAVCRGFALGIKMAFYEYLCFRFNSR